MTDLRKLLHSLDSVEAIECPQDFDPDNIEHCARRVYAELRDVLEAEWLANKSEYTAHDLAMQNVELEFVEVSSVDTSSTKYSVRLRHNLIAFEGWDQVDDDNQGVTIVLSVYRQAVSGGSLLPSVRFSNFSDADGNTLATVTAPDVIPEDFLTLIVTSLERNGCVYVPFQILMSRYEGVLRESGRIFTWWQRYFEC